MCTIDPMYCWFYDNSDYWFRHRDESKLALDLYNQEKVTADFLQEYVKFREALNNETSNLH